MAFLANALMLAGLGAACALLMTMIGALTQGRAAFNGFVRFVLVFAALGALAATPSLLTGERWAFVQDSCPRATAGGASCF